MKNEYSLIVSFEQNIRKKCHSLICKVIYCNCHTCNLWFLYLQYQMVVSWQKVDCVQQL
jgi:hypothetical protein